MRHGIKDGLKSAGYDLKDRAKIYTYVAIGAVLPLIGIRYGYLPYDEASSDIETEAGKWLMAAAYSIAPSFVGAVGGMLLAVNSRIARRIKEKKSKLENTIQGDEK